VCHLKDHASQMLRRIKSYEDIYSLVLNFDEFNTRNINLAKLKNYLDEFFNSYNELSFALSCYMLKKTILVDTEWYLYTNGQSKYLYTCLCTVKENHFFFFLHCSSFSDRAVKMISRFLSVLKINLKSIKCRLHKYIQYVIHLCIIDYLLKGDTVYLFRCSNAAVKKVVLSVKQKLYHKNYQGYWRITKRNNPYQLVQQIEKILCVWCIYYSCALTKLEILKINKAIDYAFYKWQMKQC